MNMKRKQRIPKTIRIIPEYVELITEMAEELSISFAEAANLIFAHYFTNKNPNEKNISQLFTTLANHLENSDLFKKQDL